MFTTTKYLVLAALLLSGCTITNRVKLYDGPSRQKGEISSIYIDPHVVVTKLNDAAHHPINKNQPIAHSYGKVHEVIEIAPGPIDLAARFEVLCVRSQEEIKLSFMAEAGKEYRLKSTVNLNTNQWIPTIVEFNGNTVESDYPWTQAMCKANIIILRR